MMVDSGRFVETWEWKKLLDAKNNKARNCCKMLRIRNQQFQASSASHTEGKTASCTHNLKSPQRLHHTARAAQCPTRYVLGSGISLYPYCVLVRLRAPLIHCVPLQHDLGSCCPTSLAKRAFQAHQLRPPEVIHGRFVSLFQQGLSQWPLEQVRNATAHAP